MGDPHPIPSRLWTQNKTPPPAPSTSSQERGGGLLGSPLITDKKYKNNIFLLQQGKPVFSRPVTCQSLASRTLWVWEFKASLVFPGGLVGQLQVEEVPESPPLDGARVLLVGPAQLLLLASLWGKKNYRSPLLSAGRWLPDNKICGCWIKGEEESGAGGGDCTQQHAFGGGTHTHLFGRARWPDRKAPAGVQKRIKQKGETRGRKNHLEGEYLELSIRLLAEPQNLLPLPGTGKGVSEHAQSASPSSQRSPTQRGMRREGVVCRSEPQCPFLLVMPPSCIPHGILGYDAPPRSENAASQCASMRRLPCAPPPHGFPHLSSRASSTD